MNTPLDALVATADRALDAMHEASETLSSLRITRRSADGAVTVTVDSTGALTDLQLTPDLSRASAARLGTTIVSTAADAARDALEHRASILHRMQSSLSDT